MESSLNLNETPVADVMTTTARVVSPDVLAAEALTIMEKHRISSLIVTSDSERLLGVVTLLSVLKAGIS